MFGRWNSDTEYLNHYECPPALKPQTRCRNTRWASAESLCSLCVSVLPLRHSTPPEVFLLFLPDVSPHSPLTLLHSHPRPPLQGDREMNTVRSQPDHQTTNHQLDRFISESLCRETKTLQIWRVIKLWSASNQQRAWTKAQTVQIWGCLLERRGRLCWGVLTVKVVIIPPRNVEICSRAPHSVPVLCSLSLGSLQQD